MTQKRLTYILLASALLWACAADPPARRPDDRPRPAPAMTPARVATSGLPPGSTPEPGDAATSATALAMAGPGEVALWRGGQQRAIVDERVAQHQGLLLVDIGQGWVPPLFRSSPGLPHSYQETYADLANGRFSETTEGDRARADRYLELYGITPSPALLARRFAALDGADCVERLPLSTLRNFAGVEWDEEGDEPAGPVPGPVIAALQARLHCEGHLRAAPSGLLDLRTRRAIEELERRNRIYARGNLLGETLEALQDPPLELERRALLRALTERVLLDLGVIEDGSARGALPATAPEAEIAVAPDIVSRIQQQLARSLGLSDVDGVRAFYAKLSPALERDHYPLAIEPVELPDYHSPDMDLFVEIDRGDIYYEFPFDAHGQRRVFPIETRPTLTLFARTQDGVRPLARYRTTIGGWRVQRLGGKDVWAYKDSPVGPRVWTRVVSAPVWLPPGGTPPESLVLQTRIGVDGAPLREVNRNLIGPGYASAYGLVAAYHRRYGYGAGGDIIVGGDEGIRSHGSSDYTSIWRRASLGCHRLHNHLAIRLFNFIVAHRAHRRIGHGRASFRMPIVVGDFSTVVEVKQTGYGFELARPIRVDVLPGQVRGRIQRPPKHRVPFSR